MISLLRQAAFLFGIAFLVASCTKTYSKEEINKMFEPITSKYGIKIVYEIDDDFGPILLGGEHAKFNKAVPIDHQVLARYPRLLKKAFEKYTVSVIKEYLNAIYFAKALDCDGLQYSGTYDPFRRIVYLVNDGKQSDNFSVAAFHHEFSSVLLKRHTVFLNPWLELNPRNFKYSQELTNNVEDIYGVSLEGTIVDYKDGFLNAYSQISFEDDFNEFSRIIFTQPEKFKKIMNQYPQIRSKFMIWLEFYHKIDPIFTEEYLLNKS
jgi:hypothetical protein